MALETYTVTSTACCSVCGGNRVTADGKPCPDCHGLGVFRYTVPLADALKALGIPVPDVAPLEAE